MTKENELTEKVYITRDELDDWIWVWRKPSHGSWIPQETNGCGVVTYQRENRDLTGTDAYTAADFKKKFGITLPRKTRKCVHLPKTLLNSREYKIFT